jgi:hypothetical protein
MASEFSSTNFGATVLKYFTKSIKIFVIFFSALENQIFKNIFKMFILKRTSEIFKFLTISKISFYDFAKYSTLS